MYFLVSLKIKSMYPNILYWCTVYHNEQQWWNILLFKLFHVVPVCVEDFLFIFYLLI